MTTFFTADTHFGHELLYRSVRRQFKDLKEMEKVIIDNYNSKVSENDEVYFVGDFAVGYNKKEVMEIVKQLKGIKYLILGNHDTLDPFDYVDAGFVAVSTTLRPPGKPELILHHDPCASCLVKPPTLLLCGHIHGLFKIIQNVINVGLDSWEYKPVSLEEILALRGKEILLPVPRA